jgi:hypothetical protein
MDETMEPDSDKSRMNSPHTDSNKSANATRFSTVSTEPRRRHQWQHNPVAVVSVELPARDQLPLF